MDAPLMPPPRKTAKLHHHTLESAESDLLEAKKRVAELEKIVEGLKKDAVVPRTVASDDMHEALQGPTLRLAMGWLNTKDILSCIKTCRQWKHDVDQQDVWEGALEIQSPHLLEQVKAVNPDCAFKKLAIGSIHKSDDYWYYNEATYQRAPDPPLRLDDVFLLLELKDRVSGKVIVQLNGSYRSIFYSSDESETRDFERIYLTKEDLTDYVMSLRLYRCDTGQSVGISFETPNKSRLHDLFFSRDYTVMPFANNDAGRNALRLWHSDGSVVERPGWYVVCNVPRLDESVDRPYYIKNVLIELFQQAEMCDWSDEEQALLLQGLDWK